MTLFHNLFLDLQFLVHRSLNKCTFLFATFFCRQKLCNFLFYFFCNFAFSFDSVLHLKDFCVIIKLKNVSFCMISIIKSGNCKILCLTNLAKKYMCLEVRVPKTVGPKIICGKSNVKDYLIKLIGSKKLTIF